jgi:lysophospholipase L1-like esterase
VAIVLEGHSVIIPAGTLVLAAARLLWTAGRCEAVATSIRFWRRWGAGTVVLYVFVILTIGGTDVARWWFFALAACWLAFLASPSGSCSAFTKSESKRGLEVAATNAVLALVLGELALRVYGAWTGHPLLLNERLDGFRLQPQRNYGDLLHTNSHGYPSREFVVEKRPGVRRIAALGDSFAVGVVPQDKNFLTLLEAHLPDTEVYNFGVSGAGPREYDTILLREVWPYQPDLVLLCFFVGNDVTGWWRLPNAARLDPKAYQLYVLGQRAWQLGIEALRRREEQSQNEQIRQALDLPQLSRQTHLEHELERLALCRPDEAERSERAWKRCINYLNRIEKQCRQRQAPLAVVLIPDEVQVNPDLLAETLAFGQLSREGVDLERPQRRLRSHWEKRDVPILDLLPTFSGVTDTYRPRDTHWNEKGNRLAAEAIASWLRGSSYLRPEHFEDAGRRKQTSDR